MTPRAALCAEKPALGVYPRKPPYGSPCNGCGLCCEAQLCPLGAHVFHMREGPCPALRYVDAASVCGLVAEPSRYARFLAAKHGATTLREAALICIGAGHGCDALLEGEQDKPEERERMFAACNRRPAQQRESARRVWGVR